MLVLLQARGRVYTILQGLPWHLSAKLWRQDKKERRGTMKAMTERCLQDTQQHWSTRCQTEILCPLRTTNPCSQAAISWRLSNGPISASQPLSSFHPLSYSHFFHNSHKASCSLTTCVLTIICKTTSRQFPSFLPLIPQKLTNAHTHGFS